MNIIHINPYLILADQINFNCRGKKLTALDVEDLIEDFKKHGLLQPIVVVELNNQFTEAAELEAEYTHKTVAGHRRLLAWMIVYDDKPIPCVLQTAEDGGSITEEEARVLNLIENMKRKDINILQEAKSIEHLVRGGKTLGDIADQLGVSKGWVQTRHNLLYLPEDVQQECALGVITTKQINQLYGIRAYPDTLRDMFKVMKDGQKSGKRVNIPRSKSLETRVKRNAAEIQSAIEFIGAVEFGFHTRCLAWAAGVISTTELFEDFREYCDNNGLDYPNFPDRF